MIQGQAQIRNLDSKNGWPRFDNSKIQFHSSISDTFSTASTHRRHALNRTAHSVTSSARASSVGELDRMRRRLPPIARSSVMSAAILGTHSKVTTSLLCRPSRGCLLFPCRRSSQSSLIQKVLAASTRRTALFDGVCVLCSRGCRFVSKRDRRGYFRFVPIQLAEGRPLAERFGIDPDRPDSFALVRTARPM